MRSLLVFLVLCAAGTSVAADGGVLCADVEQRLAAAQRALNACSESARNGTSAKERCEAELREAQGDLSGSSARIDSCLATAEARCSETAAFAASLLSAKVKAASCVPPETARRVQALVDGWNQSARAANALADYAAGVTDVLPRAFGSNDIDRALSKLAGSRTSAPLWNRRVLLAAFALATPRAWARLKAQGALSIEAFFDSTGPLPTDFVAEGQGEHDEPPGPAGPPLSAALKVTLSFLEVSGCESRGAPKECTRARQLVELLDATGPLIVRRRVEEMWATPCSTVSADTVRAWLQDFPVSQKASGQSASTELSQAARSKLFLCYLADAEGAPGYRAWAAAHLPLPGTLNARTLPLVDGFSSFVKDGDALDRCGLAVRALQQAEAKGCGLAPTTVLPTVSAWALAGPVPDAAQEYEVCARVANLLWTGATVTIGDEFSHPPTTAEMVRVDATQSESPLATMRAACDSRAGTGEPFRQSLVALASVGKALGEPSGSSPWRLDATGTRLAEEARYQAAQPFSAWVQHVVSQEGPCDALELSAERCAACREEGLTHYDCGLRTDLQDTWRKHRRLTAAGGALVAGGFALVVWLRKLRRAKKTFDASAVSAAAQLEGLQLTVSRSRWRWLLPAQHDTLRIELPRTPAWDRWGARAVAVLAPSTTSVREADVNHAAQVALAESVGVVFLLHDDTAVPDLGAVRGTLDWAARGGSRAVQVLLLARSRLAWATRDDDLLDLVEATTLRGNPFEVRGPVRSSSQFWNRERLVAGLLTEARAGNWVVVTGLRRFGKSSLALEVARRATGPAAYVDLAGFHHEVGHGETSGVAVEAILRTLVLRLSESAAARFPAASVPPPPAGVLDAPTLSAWLKALALACGTSQGSPPPPLLLVMDEVEQLLSTPPEKLGRALDVLATLTGRLRSAGAEPSSPHANHTVSVMWCAALHPLLWAPLATLGGQSVMGSFPSITVPALDDDAGKSMMRGLGARQGIRFEDEALASLLKASHGVPLLLRRLGTSVLELYDSDRARHGQLGAVRIGIEGATEAIRREEQEGSPLRVWVESEIAQAGTSAGVLLRRLATQDKVSVTALRAVAQQQVLERFTASGLTLHLPPEELQRRAQEAASVMVRTLANTGLLEAHGDLTAPEAYSLPDGVIRRILSGR